MCQECSERIIAVTLMAEVPVARGKRILLVEDEASVRIAYRMLLEIDDHTVVEAGNGAEALNLFAEGGFDLVITDFEMPVMKGDELAVKIKAQAPRQPILMLTAYERTRNAENPVDLILNKPVQFEDLRQGISSLLASE
jgi:two-component system, cell cycle response regulator CpdR